MTDAEYERLQWAYTRETAWCCLLACVVVAVFCESVILGMEGRWVLYAVAYAAMVAGAYYLGRHWVDLCEARKAVREANRRIFGSPR